MVPPRAASSGSSGMVVTATQKDYPDLVEFLTQNNLIHRHLDWFDTLEWLGEDVFLIEKRDQEIQALFCAAAESPAFAWIRTFSIRNLSAVEAPWQRLLSRAIEILRSKGVKGLASLALQDWFGSLLERSGFRTNQNIVQLEWQGAFPPEEKVNPPINIRPMEAADLPDVEKIDRLAFPVLWQNSLAALTRAFQQPGISTVALSNQNIVGYQISPTADLTAHLARLAVHPAMQQQRIAFTLVYDLLKVVDRLGYAHLTVNTQSDNTPSLNLYKRFGFIQTPEEIPVYELRL